MSSDFLEKNPDVYKEGLRKGWFREEKDPQERSTSLAELGVACHNLQKTMQHCPPQTQRDAFNTCVQAETWQFSAKPDPHDFDLECQRKMIDPDVNKPKEVATPDECLIRCGNFRWILAKRSNTDSLRTTTAILQKASSSWTTPSCVSRRKIRAQMMRTSTGRS